MKIRDLINQYSKKIVWGTGNYYYKYRNILPKQIAYFIDNDSFKWQTVLDEKKIFSPTILRSEKIEGTLIIVCNSYYDEIIEQLRQYGKFDAIDVENVVMVEEHEAGINCCSSYLCSNKPTILICAGIHALWQRNGARKLIEEQINILYSQGYQTVEIAPLMYLKNSNPKEQYLTVNENRHYKDLLSIDEFVKKYFYQSIIIHSLYYNYKILKELVAYKASRGKILYYLHDYFILCKQRFLFYDNRCCLDNNNILHCNECKELKKQMELQDFHSEFFARYNVTLIAPSLDTKERIEEFYPEASFKVIPHLTFKEKIFQRKKHQKLRIAFLGIAIRLKGWDDFGEIVKNNYNYYDFFCIGDCQENNKKKYVKYISAELDEEKHQTMVQALQKYEIDIAFVGSILPETYSFTYFEAYEAGCFVITTEKSGNVYKQIEKNKNGKIFRSIDEMNAWLADLEKVKREVIAMNKKILHVNINDRFINLI